MYSAKSIANFFIEKGLEAGDPVDHLKLQKLLYYAHGVHLAVTGKPLISERVEAWKFGPVVPIIYKAFRRYGAKPITELAVEVDNGTLVPALIPTDSSALRVLETVWGSYGKYEGVELSAMTHKPGTPWDQVFRSQGEWSWIPDDSIAGWFKARLTKTSA
jgi:uncharacterized phage-associated protein